MKYKLGGCSMNERIKKYCELLSSLITPNTKPEDVNKCLLIKQLSVTSNSYICSGHTRIGTDAKEHKVFASES